MRKTILFGHSLEIQNSFVLFNSFSMGEVMIENIKAFNLIRSIFCCLTQFDAIYISKVKHRPMGKASLQCKSFPNVHISMTSQRPFLS